MANKEIFKDGLLFFCLKIFLTYTLSTICPCDTVLTIMYIYVVLCLSIVKYIVVYLVFWKSNNSNEIKAHPIIEQRD